MTYDKLMELWGLTVQDFSLLTGIPADRIYNWGRGRGKPKVADTKKIETVYEKYGSKSTNEITKIIADLKHAKKFNIEVKQLPFENYMETEYLSREAQAGYLSSIANHSFFETEKILVPKEFEKGNYLVVEVTGDSMDDGTKRSICEGDKILIKELDPGTFRNFKLNFKKNIFVIMMREGAVLKEIIDHDLEKGIITCHSWNPLYQDYNVNLKDVLKIFYYKKIVERRPNF